MNRFFSSARHPRFGWRFIVVFFLAAAPAFAQTKPFVHQLFTSNMVLQRDASDPVWGWTTPGASVTVTVNGQTQSTNGAAGSGRWQVQVGPFAAGGPYTMQVSGTGQTTANFTNVYFGDVFLCSGQSNMEISVNNAYNASAEIADSVNYPNVRCFTVPKVSALTPQENISGGTWQVPGSSTTGGFSATAYFMAREIFKQQGVPIGVVASAWGGTQIQSWVDFSVSSSIADFTQTIYDQAAAPATADTISGHYNGLIYPLAPFRFKATIWYQGEFNSGRGQQYSRLLPGLMNGWRTLFGQPDMPFVIVQLPNNDATQTLAVETGGWSEIREAQVNAVKADGARSRLVTTIDIGEGNLHPLDKQDVGQRASWAMANLAYGQTSVVGQGPIFTGATVSGNTIQCTFSDVGAGLMVGTKNPKTPLSAVQEVVGGTLKGFSIAGADHAFVFANATITGPNTVSVTIPSVAAPVYVRYGWANNPVCNLYNKITNGGGTVINGLPAGSFRNDPVLKLNVNAAGGGKESYTPTTSAVTASVPSGQVFHHWGGDTAALSGSGSSTTASLSQIYVSLRAYFQITTAPTMSVSAQVGQNVVEWSNFSAVHFNLKRATSSGGPFTTIAGNLLGVTRYVDTDIADGVTYYYKVSAVNEVGEGPEAAPIAVTAIPYVRGLAATAGDALVSLTWSEFSGSALSYSVGRATAAGGPYQTIASGLTDKSYTDRSVVGGLTYYYVVSATTASGETPVSPEASAKPNFLPVPMKSQDIGTVSLAGSETFDSSGTITMKASGADISGPADSFRFIYVPITGNCTITTHIVSLENTNSFARAGVMLRKDLTPGSPYAFVFAYGNQTNSGNQFRVNANTSQGSTGAAGAVRWVRMTRAGNSFTAFSSTDGATWTAMGAAQTITDMPTTIYAGLALTSHDNTKLNTTVFDNVSGLGLQAAQAPQALSAAVRANSARVVLRWNATPGAISYNVKRATTSGGPFTTVASNLNAVRYVPTGLTTGQKYYFVVSAATGVGISPDSNQVAVDVPVISAGIPVPLELSASPGNAQASLSWSGSAIATGYNLKRATQSGGPYTTIATPTTDSYVDTGLTNGTTYYYVVSAVGSAGESANSTQVAAAPRLPANTGAIKASINSRYVSAVGTAALIANKDIIGSTELFDLTDLGGGATALRSLASGSYVSVQNPGNNQLYANKTTVGSTESFVLTFTNGNLSIKANVNSQFVSAEAAGSQPLVANRASAGSFETFTFVVAAVPKAPENVVASPSNNAIQLQWSASGGATGYVVKRATVSGGPYTQIGTPAGASFNDTSATNGTAYYYVVTAVNGGLSSAASGEVAGTPQLQAPEAPTDLSAAAVSESQIRLAWTNNAVNATAYIVQRSPHNAATWATLTSSLGAGATVYLDENLAASTDYDYRVQSTNSGGASAFASASASTPAGIGDGIPGSWRYQYFGNGLTVTSASAAGADGDGDEMTNLQEYQAGTDPTNPTSALKILSMAPAGNNLQFTFSSVSGKTYVAEKSDALVAAPVWTPVQDNIAGTGNTITVNDVGAVTQPRRFYRVKVKP